MKIRSSVAFLLLICLGMFGIGTSSCNRKSGCPAYENATVKANRKGELPSKGGKSGLFPKKMKRRMK
ncbi:MAG: hypothetical protein HUU01_04145 [Saprospiraceae bacterium]|nr:hypothetical protein [Saprospiraceae bacterium]